MGDRGQVKIISDFEGQAPVYLYTHWGGTDLIDTVKKALRKKTRWNDSCYLARIIFDAMTEGDQGSETGAGICTAQHGDIEHPIVVVDCKNQEIRLEDEDTHTVINKYTFEEFIGD